jgi:hypothetical protein
MDLFARKPVGWALSHSPDSNLTCGQTRDWELVDNVNLNAAHDWVKIEGVR